MRERERERERKGELHSRRGLIESMRPRGILAVEVCDTALRGSSDDAGRKSPRGSDRDEEREAGKSQGEKREKETRASAQEGERRRKTTTRGLRLAHLAGDQNRLGQQPGRRHRRRLN